MSLLGQAAIFFGAAVVAVPLSKRLGLGAVLGYLAAGAIIGPWGLGAIGDVESILHFAEIGVVLLLFLIGLELQPGRLWTMRKPVFGLGSLQVAASAALLSLAGAAFGLPWRIALIVAFALALSSTAFALQTLAEKGQLTTRHGRAAFSTLLFQDLAVIPMLALLPLLGPERTGQEMGSPLLGAALALGAVVVLILGGHVLLRPALRLIAASGIREVFTAMALLTVIGTALIMEHVGLSMALGAFIAGVLLADSEYRHALEADIEPFKGLLLGLFFMAVGMSVNGGLLLERPVTIAALAAGLIAIKMGVLFGLGRLSGLNRRSAWYLAVAISQGGEFAFVIFHIAVGALILEPALSDLLILVVTMSMAATPLLIALTERVAARGKGPGASAPAPAIEEDNKVIIAGFGRFGQIVGRVLRAKRIGFTALEISPQQVDFVQKFGSKVYYGDASRLDLLRAAKADKAEVFVLAVDDVDASLRAAAAVRQHFPNLTIFARARNRNHAYKLMDIGVEHISRETFLSSLDTARSVLSALGFTSSESERVVDTFREHDERRLTAHRDIHHDEEKMAEAAKAWAKELEEMFEEDAKEDEIGAGGG